MQNQFHLSKRFFQIVLLLLLNSNLYSQTGYLYQAAYNGKSYVFGYNSIPKIPIENAPEDTDWNRWSMLYDGNVYRLYFMPIGRSNVLYQFGYNPLSMSYEYGFESIPKIPILNLPSDADITNFSMLHDGENYRLYFTSSDDKELLMQCAYNPTMGEKGAYVYGYRSTPIIAVKNVPEDAYWKGWAMLHDGLHYRLYIYADRNRDAVYQFGFDGLSYTYGFASDPRISIDEMPDVSNVEKFSMLHDGANYRFYTLKKPEFK